jgi:excisionase family DNA binding protein
MPHLLLLTHSNTIQYACDMNKYEGWLTTLEAAAYLQVHIETMRRWAREGVIPAAKLGNRGGFRFKREDLDQFLEERRS